MRMERAFRKRLMRRGFPAIPVAVAISGANRSAVSNWAISSPENFRKTREHGFTIQGLKTRHRRRVESMRVGDRLLYYVTGRMGFAATVTIGVPAFVLALAPSTGAWRVEHFLSSVTRFAIAAGVRRLP